MNYTFDHIKHFSATKETYHKVRTQSNKYKASPVEYQHEKIICPSTNEMTWRKRLRLELIQTMDWTDSAKKCGTGSYRFQVERNNCTWSKDWVKNESPFGEIWGSRTEKWQVSISATSELKSWEKLPMTGSSISVISLQTRQQVKRKLYEPTWKCFSVKRASSTR